MWKCVMQKDKDETKKIYLDRKKLKKMYSLQNKRRKRSTRVRNI